MKKPLVLVILLVFTFASFAQQNQQRPEALEYIAKYKDIALAEMVRSKIPASITLAQGLHESSCGKSSLAKDANNHFGIKCKSDWDGKKMYQNDDAPNECFRVYQHASDSYSDHSSFLTTHPRYSPLFQLPITDYKSWAYGLKEAGYATNPRYSQILINTIELYDLGQYDKIGVAMIQKNEMPLNLASTASSKSNHSGSTKQTLKHNDSKEAIASAVVVADKPAAREEVTVNGLRALKAEGNEEPLKIAMEYNVDYQRILSFNDLMDGEHFKDGEYIFLEPKKGRALVDKYVVQRGESMHEVAQKFGIKLHDLYGKNGLSFTENEQLYPGETVYLQEKRPSGARTMSYAEFIKIRDADAKNKAMGQQKNSNGGTGSITTPYPHNADLVQPNAYLVQPSDTLYSIARKFNVTVEQLKAINKLETADIREGQTLVVGQ